MASQLSVMVSGRPLPGKTQSDIFGDVDHKPLFDLEHGYKMKTELAPHIEKADGYVVLPGADPLLVNSLLIGYQFQGPEVKGKPLVVYSPDDAPSPFVSLVQTLREKGFVHQREEQFYKIAKTIEDIPRLLNSNFGVMSGPEIDGHEDDPAYQELVDSINRKGANKQRPERNVAVFCSASVKDQHYLDLARDTGRLLADNGYGMVFGGSNVSMMGEVAAGTHDGGGYVTGVTIPLFFGKEMKAENGEVHIDDIRIVSDIYERMHLMIEEADALVVLPGGIGTAQEMLAVMQMRQTEVDLAAKPVVLYNEDGFWDGLKQMMEDYGYEEGVDFNVVDNQADLEDVLNKGIPPANELGGPTDPPSPSRLPSGPDSPVSHQRRHKPQDGRDAGQNRHETPPQADNPRRKRM